MTAPITRPESTTEASTEPGAQTPTETSTQASTVADVPPSRSWSPAARAVAAGLLVTGPVLVLASLLLVPQFDDRAVRLAAVAQDPQRYASASALAVAGLPLAVGATLVLALLALPRAPRLAVVGGALALVGLVGKSVVTGVEIMTDVAVSGGLGVAEVARVDAALSGANVIVAAVMFLPCSVLGVVVLTVALWRSGAVPIGVVALQAGLLVLDVGLDQPLLGYACVLAAQTWVAVLIVRGGYLRPRRTRRS